MSLKFSYDYWKNLETPDYVLCNVSKQPIGTLQCINKKMTYSNEIPEISFKIYRMINGEINKYYDLITSLQYIYVKDIGYFQITSHPTIINDEQMEYKEVKAQSTEIEFGQKYLTLFTINMGTVESIDGVSLYNNADPSHSLLDLVLEKLPSWKIGYVDPKFLSMQRSFQIDKQDVYSFLTSDVAEVFNCVFIFDTINNTINVYDNEKISKDTNIVISFKNLLKEVTIDPDVSSIKTALTLVGEDDLTVRELNMGYDTIYNFDYFHTVEYMGQDLYDAYALYKEKYQDCTLRYIPLITEYQDILTQIAYKTSEMLPEEADSKDWTQYSLNELNTQKKAYEGNLSVLMQQGYGDAEKNPNEYTSLYLPQYEEIEKIKAEIEVRTNEIAVLKAKNDEINTQMQAIIEEIDIENNFTEEQWLILSKFIREDVLTDNNYVVTDTMTQEEALEMQQAFLDFGNEQLAKYSQPQFAFKVSMGNIFAVPEFQEHINDFELFNYINILIRDNYYMKAKLLSFDINFEEKDISVNFASLNKVKNSNIFSMAVNAISQANSASTSVSFNKFSWNKAKKQSEDIAQNISDGLLKAGYSLENTRSTMVTDDRGLFMKNTPESINPNDEMALTGSNIIFSDNNWKTTRSAVGRVSYKDLKGNDKEYYGVLTELVAAGYITGCTVYANEIIGSSINNGNGTFQVDKDGNMIANSAKIKGDFTANTIATNSGKFTVDKDGKLIAEEVKISGEINATSGTFTGNITATSGNIGGWDIQKTYIGTKQVSSTKARFYMTSLEDSSDFWIRALNSTGERTFSVSKDGQLYASGVDIKGNITATSGKIGGATIKNGNLYADNNNWALYEDGSAMFKNVTITGVKEGSSFGGVSFSDGVTSLGGITYSGGSTFGGFNGGFSAGTSFDLKGFALKDFNKLVVEQLTVSNINFNSNGSVTINGIDREVAWRHIKPITTISVQRSATTGYVTNVAYGHTDLYVLGTPPDEIEG